MGLDITYYKNLTKLDCVFDADGEPIDPTTRGPLSGKYLQAGLNEHFPGRAEEIEDRAVYRYDGSGGFRAGSYSGYNQWREELAKMAGYPAIESERHRQIEMRHDAGAWQVSGGPFWELICFSDCEGMLGAKVSAKLAGDFELFQGKADAHESQSFRALYADWRKAFEMASINGAVDFH